MNKEEIISHIEKIAVKSKDDQIKLNALSYLYGLKKSEELDKETKEVLAKSKEKSKEISEILAKVISDGFGG